ncbi:MAG: gfo/Idh/MocA family oxidoreductase, partial [Planctomycetaceae bacterium]|nr:gfo/Idh/MocA family oxidoreductase [Planctomycetaceae bacterium]
MLNRQSRPQPQRTANPEASFPKPSRRDFLAATTATAFSFTIVPRHVLGGQGQTPPSERLNVAGIGCGGMGGGDIATISKLGANF